LWIRDGEVVEELENKREVPPSFTKKGESWMFKVLVHDGEEFDQWRESAILKIKNAPPSIKQFMVKEEEESICIRWDVEDMDEDAVKIKMAYKKGEDMTTFFETSENIGAKIFALSLFGRGTMQFLIFADDGEDVSKYTFSIKVGLPENLSRLLIYPNPYIPHDGDPDTGVEQEGIFFDNLPSSTKIRIYNLLGECIYREEGIDEGYFLWDTKDEDGEYVKSGVYIYSVESGDERKSGKLLIVR
jgi:hypothetical protein